MGVVTKISWTDHTFNPWIGCTKVSPACDFCYAEVLDKNRFGGGHWGPGAPRRRTKTWGDPIKWNKAAVAAGERRRIFMASLADFFDNEVDPTWRAEAWQIVKQCQQLDWLILTKRIGNVAKMLPDDWHPDAYPNVVIIISVGDQEEANRDIPKLLEVKEKRSIARVGLSIEPMLGPIKLWDWIVEPVCCGQTVQAGYDEPPECCGSPDPAPTGAIDWVICGGESGDTRRPFDIEAAEALRVQCAASLTPFYFKQDGGRRSGERGRASDELWGTKEFPRDLVAAV